MWVADGCDNFPTRHLMNAACVTAASFVRHMAKAIVCKYSARYPVSIGILEQ